MNSSERSDEGSSEISISFSSFVAGGGIAALKVSQRCVVVDLCTALSLLIWRQVAIQARIHCHSRSAIIFFVINLPELPVSYTY